MHFIYEKFKGSIKNIIDKIQNDEKFRLDKLLELLAAFLNFCVHTYPDKIEYVDQILNLSTTLCQKVEMTAYNEKELECMVNILSYPLETMSIVVLNLTNYPNLMGLLPFERRKTVSIKIIEAVLNTRTYLLTENIAKRFVSFIEPLLTLQADAVKMKAKVLEKEQTLVARLLHYVQSHDPNITIKMLKMFEEKFAQGPIEWKKYTIPSLMTCYCRFGRRAIQVNRTIAAEEDVEALLLDSYDYRDSAVYLTEEEKDNLSFKVAKVEVDFAELFENMFIHIEELSLDFPAQSIRLYLELAALVTEVDKDEKVHDEFQYDICSEALELYQDEISDSKEKVFIFSFSLDPYFFRNSICSTSSDRS